MLDHEQSVKLAYAVIADAFKDLLAPKLRESAFHFLINDGIDIWAELVKRDSKDIKAKAQEIYNDPEKFPKIKYRTGGRSEYYCG